MHAACNSRPPTYYVTKGDLELMTLLPLPPEYWHYRGTPPHPLVQCWGLNLQLAGFMLGKYSTNRATSLAPDSIPDASRTFLPQPSTSLFVPILLIEKLRGKQEKMMESQTGSPAKGLPTSLGSCVLLIPFLVHSSPQNTSL